MTTQTTQTTADSLNHAIDSAVPPIKRAADQAAELARRGVNALNERGEAVRRQALQVSDTTRDYIRDEPMKSVLIAAATGAALMALVSLLSRSRDH